MKTTHGSRFTRCALRLKQLMHLHGETTIMRSVAQRSCAVPYSITLVSVALCCGVMCLPEPDGNLEAKTARQQEEIVQTTPTMMIDDSRNGGKVAYNVINMSTPANDANNMVSVTFPAGYNQGVTELKHDIGFFS